MAEHRQPPVDERAVNGLSDVDEAGGTVGRDQGQATRHRLGDERRRQCLLVRVANLDQQPRRLLVGEAADEPALSNVVNSRAQTR